MTKKGKIWMIFFLAMTLGVLFQTAPECQARVYSGKCKSNLTWYYNTKTKTITIDCKGEMPDDIQYRGLSMDWQEYSGETKRVVFRKGITSIGYDVFGNFYKLEEVVLPEGLREIKEGAFESCVRLRKINFPSSLKKLENMLLMRLKYQKFLFMDFSLLTTSGVSQKRNEAVGNTKPPAMRVEDKLLYKKITFPL